MTNLVFDINNMLFRSMFVLGGFQTNYSFDNQKEIDELMRKISTDTAFLVRLINPSRVIFAKDDRSWRKKIEIEENEGYKGTRKQNEFINWENVYRVLDEFLDIAEENGMIVSRVDNAEADDLCALWKRELLYNQKQHVVIVSGDEDIRQLVDYYEVDNTKIFSTVFNPFKQGKNASRKLYVTDNFNEWLNETQESDIWNMNVTIDVDKGDFKRIRDTSDVKLEVVDGNHIAMRKVFCGDDGDNIPSIYTWVKTTAAGDEKETRITNAPFTKLYEGLKNSPNDVITHKELIAKSDKVLQGIRKIVKHEPTFDIKTRLERQIKLVVLDPDLFPRSIVKSFDESKNEFLSRKRPDIADMNMNSFLQGTRYVRSSNGVRQNTGNESSIFKEIDRLTQSKSLF